MQKRQTKLNEFSEFREIVKQYDKIVKNYNDLRAKTHDSPCVTCTLRYRRKNALTFSCKWVKICKKYREWYLNLKKESNGLKQQTLSPILEKRCEK